MSHAINDLTEARRSQVAFAVADLISYITRDIRRHNCVVQLATNLFRRTKPPTEVIVYTCCLLNKLTEYSSRRVTSQNITRYLFAAFVVAYTMVGEYSPTLSSWEFVTDGKYTVPTVLVLVQHFLGVMRWDLFVKREAYEYVLGNILAVINRLTAPKTGTPETPSVPTVSRLASFIHTAHPGESSSYSYECSDTEESSVALLAS